MKDHFRQAISTAARMFDFKSRASRSEFIGYLLLSQLPVAVTALGTAWLEPAPTAKAVMTGVVVLVSLPLFALGVRRFHDFGRTGWWSAPFSLLVGRTLLLDIIGLAAGWSVREPIEVILGYVDWLLMLPAVASFVAMLAWPGKVRFDQDAAVSTTMSHETADTSA